MAPPRVDDRYVGCRGYAGERALVTLLSNTSEAANGVCLGNGGSRKHNSPTIWRARSGGTRR
eukprot:585127-Alexandrium_andersonii.AAC.1